MLTILVVCIILIVFPVTVALAFMAFVPLIAALLLANFMVWMIEEIER